MNPKGISSIVIILIIVGVLILGAGVYVSIIWTKKIGPHKYPPPWKPGEPPPTEETGLKDETMGWKILLAEIAPVKSC